MALVVPNSIDNDTAADAAEVEENFATIETYINTNVLHRDGSVALIAPVLLPGDPTQPNQAANKGYVDAGDAAQGVTAAAATALKVNKAGDTVTGQLKGITPVAAEDLTRKDYVDTKLPLAGGTVTGQISGITPTAAAHLTRKDYVDAQDAAYYNSAVARMDSQDAAYYNGYTVHKVNRFGDTMTGVLYFNADPFVGNPGSMITTNTAAINTHTATGHNLYLFHSGGAYDTNSHYITFCGQTGSTTLGAVLQTSSAGVAYYSASDYRLKDDLGPIEDPVSKLMALQPKRLRWKSDGSEFDGFIAHELDEVVPYAVSGEKDAVDDDGNIVPQMTDPTNVVALLTAALQEALTRIEALENAA